MVRPRRIVITTSDGVVLEGAWSPPDGDAARLPPTVAGIGPAPRLIVLGDRDQIVPVEEMQGFSALRR